MKTLMRSLVNISAVVCLVLSMTTLVSCKKTNEDLIVGTWKCTSVSLNPQNFIESQRYIEELSTAKFLFTDEKYVAIAIGNERSYGNYSIDGDKLVIIIMGKEDPVVAKVNLLDSKRFSFTYSQKAYDEDDEGHSRYITVAVTLNLDKIEDAH